ncbi:MAG TPA: hypothetical protein VJ726_10885, partial [Candidatus Limnocylindria bacterium]|nr:hypothetical protein [Candidatus Limnocylindria bacterium]
ALANSVATLAEAALLLALLAPRARLRLVGLGYATLKQVTAALFMGVAMFLFINFTNIPLNLAQDPPKLLLFVQTLLATSFGVGVYLLAAYVMRISELQEIIAVVQARLRRGKAAA